MAKQTLNNNVTFLEQRTKINSNFTELYDGQTLQNTKITNLEKIPTATKEPTGFVNRTSSVISFVEATRTFTIAPAVDNFKFFIAGVEYTVSAAENIIISDVEGLHYIYYNGATLSETTTYNNSLITDYVLIAVLYWDATNNKIIPDIQDERHGLTMDSETHKYLHSTRGTQFLSGLAINNILINEDGSLDTHFQLSVENGYITDEDIIQAISGFAVAPASILILYLTGTGIWRYKAEDDLPAISFGVGDRLAYNLYSTGAWSQAEVPDLNFTLTHIFATSNSTKSIIGIQGQNYYSTISNARLGATIEIENLRLLGLPAVEYVPIATIILQTKEAFTNTYKAIIVSTDLNENYIDWRFSKINEVTPAISHSSLSKLTNDDHKQYALFDGLSTGIIGAVPTFTDNGNGTITIPACSVALFNNSTFQDRIEKYTVAQLTNLLLTDNVINYVIIKYTNGIAAYDVTTNVDLITESEVVPVFTIYREGTTLHSLNWDSLGKGLSNKLHQRFVKTQRFAVETGLVISKNVSNEFFITAGKTWTGAVNLVLNAFNSTTDLCELYYHDSGAWAKAAVTTLNNTQYDDGTDLQSLLPNKYVINYIYRLNETTPHTVILLSTTYGSSAEARLASAPSNIPELVKAQGVLIGRIIIETNDTGGTIESYLTKNPTIGAIENHNDLSGLQGSALNEYYHLKATEQDKVSKLDSGYVQLTEITTPATILNNGLIYTKADNKLYFKDGAGTEHEIAFV